MKFYESTNFLHENNSLIKDEKVLNEMYFTVLKLDKL